MSFWNTSSGEAATGEVQENNFEPLPKGDYLSLLESAEIKEYEGERTINFKARAIESNRVVFPKLRVFDSDDKKRDRAIQLLVKLANSVGVPLPKGEPDDIWLSKLCDKPLIIKYDVFTFTPPGKSEEITGNFIINFEAKGAKAGSAKPAGNKPGPQPAAQPAPNFSDTDDDIPF